MSSFERLILIPRPASPTFQTNEIDTCKYSLLTFLPKNLFQQFHKLANLYFLLIAGLQTIPVVTITNGIPSILLPLGVVLIISGLKDLIEDRKRSRADNEENNRKCVVWNAGMWIEKKWGQVKVGDIVKTGSNEFFPADLVLLSSPTGCCYIETKNLDGETNLKYKQGVFPIAEELETLLPQATGSLICELPNNRIYQFNGVLTFQGEKYFLNQEHCLLRGSSLRNTDWILGLAVYTGKESKVMLNSASPRTKFSFIEELTNVQIVCVFVFELFLCVFAAAVEVFILYDSAGEFPYLMLRTRISNPGLMFLYEFLTWLLIFSNLVPISLIVTLEIVKFVQGWFIAWDLEMYDESTDRPVRVNSSNLNEDLGQASHLFSDKTGTLTCNVMKLRKLSIGGRMYGRDERVTGTEILPYVDFFDPDYWEDVETPAVLGLTKAMAMCHTAMAHKDENGSIRYQAVSPDELTLVYAAQYLGVTFQGWENGFLTINFHGQSETYKVVHILEFTSQRKRMSVIVHVDAVIRLICKGADSAVQPRLKSSSGIIDLTWAHLEAFASAGLRTLVYAYRDFSIEEFAPFTKRFATVCSDVRRREELLDQLADDLERDLELLGATGIEDKLQDQVPETLSALREAGIKVWMLTGDKKETAVSIGFSTHLLSSDMTLINLISIDSALDVLKTSKQLQINNPNDRFALVLSGDAFCKIAELGKLSVLFRLADRCTAVLACRLSPDEKAEIVRRASGFYTASRILAIGDGANDVSMITAAHVGIGIAGLEGMQAARASDYSISQFHFLKRLLLVHGRESYRKNSTLVCFTFYKNLLAMFPVFCYGTVSMFSGLFLYNMWLLQLFNILFSAVPICMYAVIDREMDYSLLEMQPTLYDRGRKNELFTWKAFWWWQLEACFQGMAACVLFIYVLTQFTNDSRYGKMNSIWTAGVWIYSYVVLAVNLKVLLLTTEHQWVSLLFTVLSTSSYFLCLIWISEVSHIRKVLDNWEMYGVVWDTAGNIDAYSVLLLALFISFAPGHIRRTIQTSITTVKPESGNLAIQGVGEVYETDLKQDREVFKKTRKDDI